MVCTIRLWLYLYTVFLCHQLDTNELIPNHLVLSDPWKMQNIFVKKTSLLVDFWMKCVYKTHSSHFSFPVHLWKFRIVKPMFPEGRGNCFKGCYQAKPIFSKPGKAWGKQSQCYFNLTFMFAGSSIINNMVLRKWGQKINSK